MDSAGAVPRTGFRKVGKMRKDCGTLIKQIHDEMRKTANNAMRAQDMTFAQLEALRELDMMPEKQCSLKELERRMRVAQSTAAGIIARLERKGFVEGFGDASDRRVKMVRITPEGIACANEAKQDRERAEKRLLSGLTETERDIFYTLLKKVRDSMG